VLPTDKGLVRANVLKAWHKTRPNI